MIMLLVPSWEKIIKKKEFILTLTCTEDVMSTKFTSYSVPKILTIVGTEHVQKVKGNLVIRRQHLHNNNVTLKTFIENFEFISIILLF